jgi:hypothetical protein
MTRDRRTRRKLDRAARGKHTVLDHRPEVPDPEHPGHFLPVRCPRCRPPAKAAALRRSLSEAIRQ